MTQNAYKHPPITEAVIEIKFKHIPDKGKVDKFIKKLKGVYTNYQEEKVYSLDIDMTNAEQDQAKTKTTPQIIYRFSSEDMTQQLLLNNDSFVISQLAPYCGWKDFIKRFTRDWEIWKKQLGHNEIKQIGVRYINRLDVPVTDSMVEFSEYVNVYPIMPELLDPQLSHAIQAKIPIDELKCSLSLNSAVVKSPLLNHMSLVIDQDIAKAFETPQNDKEIYSYLNKVHVLKNKIFESCITDKARELFNK